MTNNVKNQRQLLLRVLSGWVKLSALWLGTCFSILLLFVSSKVLLQVTAVNHIALSFSAPSNKGFWLFALIVGGVMPVLALVTGVFAWTFIKNFHGDKELTNDLIAYLASRKIDAAEKQQNESSKKHNLPRYPKQASFFVDGVASILDFGGTLNRSGYGLTPRQRDYLALKSDWTAVGNDLRTATTEFEQDLAPDKGNSLSSIGEASA